MELGQAFHAVEGDYGATEALRFGRPTRPSGDVAKISDWYEHSSGL